MVKAHTLAGNGTVRRLQDYYATPGWVTEGLLQKERFWGRVWEPACGAGYISKILKSEGLKVFSSDKYGTVPERKPEITKEQMKKITHRLKVKEITEEEYMERCFNMIPIFDYAASDVDFTDDKKIEFELCMKWGWNNTAIGDYYPDHIITNPPFCLFKEFILQAKKYAKHKISFFGKLNFLCCQNRYEIWQDREFPLKKVIVLVDRVKFPGYDEVSPLEMAWFVWDKDYDGKPQFELMLKKEIRGKN